MDVPTTATLSEYTLQEQLGHGSFGVVYKAVREGHDKPVAIKIVPADKDYASLMSEIGILRSCDSPFITRYFGSAVSDGDVWIVLEFCGGGSVSELVSASPDRSLPLRFIATVTASMVAGLDYLHRNHLLHRDIKCSNVLLTEEGSVKLADFGVCAKLGDTVGAKQNTLIGTPFWMAPEVIREDFYDYKADIWSLGISVIEMADGAPPFSHMHPMRAIFLIPMMTSPPQVRDEANYPEEMLDFIAQCLSMTPDNRPSSQALVDHPFVKDDIVALRASDGVSEPLGEAVREANVKLAAIRSKKAKKHGGGGGGGGDDDDGDDGTPPHDSDGSYTNPLFSDFQNAESFTYDPNDDLATTNNSLGIDGMADFYAMGLSIGSASLHDNGYYNHNHNHNNGNNNANIHRSNSNQRNGQFQHPAHSSVNRSLSGDSHSPMVNSSGYNLSDASSSGHFSRLTVTSPALDSSLSPAGRSSDMGGLRVTPDRLNNSQAQGLYNTPFRLTGPASASGGGHGAGARGDANEFVLSGGLVHRSKHARDAAAAHHHLRRASRKPRSKDEVHSQLRAIDEQYRCDLAALEAVFAQERKRIMGALRVAQERGL
eukprot:INCI2821.1.p1 GENE.INCI2821.1~~INCI2821.1.p1  ORF type:complete len:598 (+),score=103.43 INCI2821.1:2105-3898(+)